LAEKCENLDNGVRPKNFFLAKTLAIPLNCAQPTSTPCRALSPGQQWQPGSQTSGNRRIHSSGWTARGKIGFPLELPNHPRYLNTEFVDHTYNTKSIDNADRLIEHTLRHARVHDQLSSQQQYAGGIAWCAFDYNTHANFGSGDRICYHGVADIFREPKPAAAFYKSQCDPAEEVVVLELAFHWAPSNEAGGLNKVVLCSNCDHIKVFVEDSMVIEVDPDRTQFPHLPHPPFVFEDKLDGSWGDLRLEGYIAGRESITKYYSGKGVDQKFELVADDTTLIADGADATRVVFRVTDEFGNVRPFSTEPIQLDLDGPAELIGDPVFSLAGGLGAVWVRANETAGRVQLKATHPSLGSQLIEIEIAAAEPEIG
jgi:beta-galactosidase